ncbi:hypothetical protein D3C73_631760 [compost metagenome]
MSEAALLRELEDGGPPSRRLDTAIGLVGGFRPIGNYDDVTLADWRDPINGEAGPLPLFTSVIDHAILFARCVAAPANGGCSWENGRGSAILNERSPAQSVNPALAICIAAMRARTLKNNSLGAV